jgi:hypothetical protein
MCCLEMNRRARLGTDQPRRPEGGLEITSLAPLGERVARDRRFHQPGRDG